MSALRLARAVTGREKVLKFAGAYHGHVDGLLAEAGSGLATQGIPASPGVPAGAAAATVIVPWNDPEALIAATQDHELAAILAEPVPANMGVVPPAAGFLELLRAPGRRDRGPAHLRRGHHRLSGRPRGRPGALRGPARSDHPGQDHRRRSPRRRLWRGGQVLMERIAPAGDVYQAGTLSGNPLAVAAAWPPSSCSTKRAYDRSNARPSIWPEGLQEAADAGRGSADRPARAGSPHPLLQRRTR